ncbi:MAG TPA: cobyrinate a,c-diamide synthase [Acidimicrobiales bacterium]|nr:cobyrinate a,c-diamide synthase [Acidimicrobiales bacterium]
MSNLAARVMIAGTASGVGKTTVATGLVAALTARGRSVATAKVGPDFIDPGYHSLASGRPPRNLDPWLCGPDAIAPLAARAAAGSDLLVIEGVMGLYDGAVDGTPSSTADVAALLDAPVLLVVDAGAMSASVAALVRGYRDHDPRIELAGVVLNQVGSPGHEQLLREAVAPLGIPVLGALPRDDALRWRDRHLGLVPVAERPAAVRASLDRLAAAIAGGFDLDAVEAVARAARSIEAVPPPTPLPVGRCRIAVAAGAAFTFAYQDNVDALEAAGAEVVAFDPLHAAALPPAVDGLIVGGGFPEVHAAALSGNAPLRADAARRIAQGLPVWAECGGLLWLARELDGRPMVGAVPTRARLGDRLVLGYREAQTRAPSPLGPAGTRMRGHEFHYSICQPPGGALRLTSRFGTATDGFATPTLLATYLHHHAGGDPSIVRAFVSACVAARSSCPEP